MFPVDSLILVGGILLLFAIASSKFSSRIGVPVLVLFLAVGMLAGSEGIGGIEFENYVIAHGVGTLALAVILFDGGLRTPMSSIRLAYKPALLLATLGVLITAVITGIAASWVLGVTLLEGVLLGSIVGSTDAAAVFSLLRGRGLHLRQRVAATLEVESGSNDPMAVFLTVGILEVLQGGMEPGWALLGFFLLQAVVGVVAGLGVGRLAVLVNNRINLDAAGLYPILMGASGLLAFGLSAMLGGSGFLAVYLAGIVLGNSRIVFQRGILLFTDGIAWLGQIVMFIVLGLLSFPTQLLEVAAEGFIIAAVLIFLARPLAVASLLLPFGFDMRELGFLSWVGLKGAVPIVLATYPLLFGLPSAPLLFNVVFFVVLISALTQGWSIPAVAKALRLEVPSDAEPPLTLEITSLRHVDGDIVEYTIGPESRAAGRLVRDLSLPDGVVIALIARAEEVIPPRGSTRILAHDHVFVVLRPGVRPLMNRVFSRVDEGPEEDLPLVEFPLHGTTTVRDLEEFYGILVDAPGSQTLEELMLERLGDEPLTRGRRVDLGDFALYARQLDDDGIERCGSCNPREEWIRRGRGRAMRVVLQRVASASVKVDGKTAGAIEGGLALLVGFASGDSDEDLRWMAEKIVGLRVFADEDGKMNVSVADRGGGLLVVSQFTLYGDTRKGRRPSFVGAAPPEIAIPLYERFIEMLSESGLPVESGEFGADMSVELVNDGPVTLILER